MRMISKVMRSMRDTGLLDGMSDDDCDTLATAALEGLLLPSQGMIDAYRMRSAQGDSIQGCYNAMILDALQE